MAELMPRDGQSGMGPRSEIRRSVRTPSAPRRNRCPSALLDQSARSYGAGHEAAGSRRSRRASVGQRADPSGPASVGMGLLVAAKSSRGRRTDRSRDASEDEQGDAIQLFAATRPGPAQSRSVRRPAGLVGGGNQPANGRKGDLLATLATKGVATVIFEPATERRRGASAPDGGAAGYAARRRLRDRERHRSRGSALNRRCRRAET